MSNEEPISRHTAAPSTAVQEPSAQEPLEDDDEWRQEPQELPPRPRRHLLTPALGALLAVLLTAGGFVAGVLVEKGQSSSTGSAAGGGGGRGAGFGRLRGTSGSGSTSSAGVRPGGAGGGGPTVGQVAFIQGATLYVTNTQGNTVKVATSPGSTVTKTVKASLKSIHPGETVIVTGTTGAGGTISAESIRVGGSGEGGGLASLLGGSGQSSGGSGQSSGGSGASGARSGEPSLFGKGG